MYFSCKCAKTSRIILPTNVVARRRLKIRRPFTTSIILSKEVNDPDMFISDLPNPFKIKKKTCVLCKYKIPVDYKNVRLLSQFVSPYTGFTYEKHITGLCEEQHKRVTKAILKARTFGFMPYHLKLPKYVKDPKLYDVFNPSRPHPH